MSPACCRAKADLWGSPAFAVVVGNVAPPRSEIEPGWHRGAQGAFAELQDFPGSRIECLQLAQRLSDLKDLSFLAGQCGEHDPGRAMPVANAAPGGGACWQQGLLQCPCRVHTYAFQIHNPPLGSAGGLGRARCQHPGGVPAAREGRDTFCMRLGVFGVVVSVGDARALFRLGVRSKGRLDVLLL